MNKLIFLVCLIYVNGYANKNWIPIDSHNSSGIKMYQSPSSFNKARYQNTKKKQRMKAIDVKLLNSIRHVQSLAKRYK